jgi:hypothetical protein
MNRLFYYETFTKIAKKEARLRFLRAEGIFTDVLPLFDGGDFYQTACAGSAGTKPPLLLNPG